MEKSTDSVEDFSSLLILQKTKKNVLDSSEAQSIYSRTAKEKRKYFLLKIVHYFLSKSDDSAIFFASLVFVIERWNMRFPICSVPSSSILLLSRKPSEKTEKNTKYRLNLAKKNKYLHKNVKYDALWQMNLMNGFLIVWPILECGAMIYVIENSGKRMPAVCAERQRRARNEDIEKS